MALGRGLHPNSGSAALPLARRRSGWDRPRYPGAGPPRCRGGEALLQSAAEGPAVCAARPHHRQAGQLWSREARTLAGCRALEEPLYPDSPSIRRNPLAKRREPDSTDRMIRPGFLDSESRQDLIELARDGAAAHRLARRANALVLLDDGMSCEAIARVLLLDDDTVRTWYRLYEEEGIEGLASFGYEGSSCRLDAAQ